MRQLVHGRCMTPTWTGTWVLSGIVWVLVKDLTEVTIIYIYRESK